MKLTTQTILVASIIIYFFNSVNLFAQNNEYEPLNQTSSFEAKLAEHTKSTHSIKSEFIQEKHLWMLDEILISKGEFLYKKQNSIKWQYNTPIEYSIIIHNGKFTIINNNKISNFDIDSNPLFTQINNMVVTAISGDFINNNNFESAFFENDSNYLAKLIPVDKKVSSMLQTIEIYFNKSSMDVVKVVFREPGDDFTLISFYNKDINCELNDDLFIIEN